MSTFKKFILLELTFLLSLLVSTVPAFANNLSISNVSLEERTPSSNKVVVELDVSWDNSWKTKINHDGVWLTVRLYDPTVTPIAKRVCDISAAGLNPTGTSKGSNAGLDVYVPTDKKGFFLRPNQFGAFSNSSTTDMQVTIDYSSCGFTNSDSVQVSVFGLEMVYIPEGQFYAGDYGASTAAFTEGSSDTDPWYISSASAISVSNPTSNGYRYVSSGNAGEDTTGSSFTIPANFPKGYSGFYAMKYELTEGQWVEFLNALPSHAARVNRDLTNSSHKNTDSVVTRNTINCSGSPLVCSTSRSQRAVSFLTWTDLAAFLDWAALRPMTELEFEKVARGPLLAVSGEYAWGTSLITVAAAISGSNEDGTEIVSTSSANAHYNATTLTGGDAGSGSNHQTGPLRVGIFATNSSNRETSGAGYYGVMDFSGNLHERVVTIGNATGRSYQGTHGDGVLTTLAGYEGNANQTDWPGIDATITRGVTGAAGSGFRGGAWDDVSSALRISDRTNAANGTNQSFNNAGGRGVRTYDGN